MDKITPALGLHDIHQSLLADLQDESKRNPQFGVTSIASDPSVTPLRTVQDLDGRIEFAEQSLEKAYLRLLSHATTAKRRRNTFLPIFKLPTEILSAILEMTRDLEDGEEDSAEQRPNHVKHLLNLAAVSSRFFSVVMGTATLWAVADWRCSPSQVKTCLERSLGASITVKYSWRGWCTKGNNIFSKWWLDSLVSEHIARWRDAELGIISVKELDMLPKVTAPQLQRIVVDSDLTSFGEPIHLFGGSAPKLTTISLRGIHLHWKWDPGMIANLRSLVLRRILIPGCTARSFLSDIRLSSMLEKLVIRGIRFGETVDLTPDRGSLSWLKSLKEMAITDVPCDISRHLLGTIRAPHVQSATIEFSDQGNVEDWGQLIVSCLDNSILRHVEQAVHIELQFSDIAARMSLITDLGPPVLLGLEGLHFNPDAIGWFLENIVAHRKQPTLSVRLSGRYSVNHDDVRQILPHFLRLQDVTRLELEPNPLLELSLLSRPISGADQEEWLWPRLTSVTFSGNGWSRAERDILALVRVRLGRSSVTGDIRDAAANEHERRSRPARIQNLNMPQTAYISQTIRVQLKNLVPDCQLPPEPLNPFDAHPLAFSPSELDLAFANEFQ
ncbi:hypothetical protein FRC01_006377 [Tulasnella sp. 417]|nr:hypothetical protein FRC01_006377 [Tulasnella sp. 417]